MTPRSLADTLVDAAGFAVRHPVRSTLRTIGAARGVAALAIGRAGRAGPHPVANPPVTRVPGQREPLPAAEQLPPTEPAESFATEPTATSFDDAHGGSAPLEDWEDELDDGVDAVTPVGTTAAEVGWNPDTAESDLQQPGTEPLLDPSLTKQVKADLDRGLRDASPGEPE